MYGHETQCRMSAMHELECNVQEQSADRQIYFVEMTSLDA